ncbi:unnamed protein product [Linum trigynum]|uniref:Uncharacterized protein n=1 Tax=Linum trigynum TaxID=586398 RepID=A0AAV2FBP3_9ROSI
MTAACLSKQESIQLTISKQEAIEQAGGHHQAGRRRHLTCQEAGWETTEVGSGGDTTRCEAGTFSQRGGEVRWPGECAAYYESCLVKQVEPCVMTIVISSMDDLELPRTPRAVCLSKIVFLLLSPPP